MSTDFNGDQPTEEEIDMALDEYLDVFDPMNESEYAMSE